MRTLTLITLLAALALPTAARAGQAYLVSERFDLGNNRIWRLEDTTGDDDALDAGERTVWADGFTGSLAGIDFFNGSAYVVEADLGAGNNRIIRLTDVNGDGDALDVGEHVVWADSLNAPVDVARDAAGNFYVTEFLPGEVWRLVDGNGDGDVLDSGERTLYADSIFDASMLLPWGDDLLVTAYFSGEVQLLTDANGDGDALDAAERVAIASGIGDATGLFDDGSGGFYVTSFVDDTVYHATDGNGDGDFFDVAEVLSYADPVNGHLNDPWNMANYPGGGFLLANLQGFGGFEVLRVLDGNGDGDALDVGEVVTFADGILGPADIVALPLATTGDYNGDGTVNAADYTVWRNSLHQSVAILGEGADGNQNGTVDQSDYTVWRDNYGATLGAGATAGSSSSASGVPEPCTLTLCLLAAVGLINRRGRRERGGTGD